MSAYWHKYLPPAPPLPRSLWPTAGGVLLALLSYGFQAELWPNHPAAGGWSLTLLSLLLVAGLLQLHCALHRWRAAIAGPGWLRLLFRIGVIGVQVGTALLLWLGLLASLLVLVLLA